MLVLYESIDRSRAQMLQLLVDLTQDIMRHGNLVLPKMTVQAGLIEGRLRQVIDTQIYYIQKGTAFEFNTSEACYAAITCLCRALHVPRHCLNILAHSKGAYAGPIQVQTTQETGPPVVDNGFNGQAVQVRPQVLHPGRCTIASTLLGGAAPRGILVVEKETIFRALVGSRIHEREQLVLLTGSGVPCLASRAFLAVLASTFQNVPVIGLFDWNPHGIAIALTYAHGSTNQPESYWYATPQLEMLGMMREDVLAFGSGLDHCKQAFSQNDTRKVASLKNRFPGGSPCIAGGLESELDFMLSQGYKLDLEAMNQISGQEPDFLQTTWLPSKLARYLQ